MKNPILDELYAAREKLLAEHGGDLAAYLKAAAEKTTQSKHPLAQIKQRNIRVVPTIPPVDLPAENSTTQSADR